MWRKVGHSYDMSIFSTKDKVWHIEPYTRLGCGGHTPFYKTRTARQVKSNLRYTPRFVVVFQKISIRGPRGCSKQSQGFCCSVVARVQKSVSSVE